ncbi:archaeosortase/exosortase family protein [Pelagicoccus enzymogenes]|uniref:archaeosortase/exosortase family protein n=1 Tax=Pelagicoccus enzymogenes TaxID=2773457 RepID=UPI002812094F|nr:archaeosortase/exosortase family protein [Pelagicoccus enzymogenes]
MDARGALGGSPWLRCIGRFLSWRGRGDVRSFRFLCSLALLVVCWPTVRWYAARMVDGSDEPWGVLALGAAVGFAFLGRRRPVPSCRYVMAAGFLLVPLAAPFLMTPLVYALFVFLAVAALWADSRIWIGHAGLFVLALPLISSLQFYGGFPLRWLIGKMSAAVLSFLGWGVEARGTVMHWRGEMVVIDAPCSGVQMLWGSAFLACVMICIQKPNLRGSVLLLQVASFSAFIGNVLRNVLLFFVESKLWDLPDWGHDGVGMIVFALVLAVIVAAGSQLRAKAASPPRAVDPRRSAVSASCPLFLFLVLALLVVTRPDTVSALPEGRVVRADIMDTIRSELFEEGWVAFPLDERSAAYAKGFPGAIELFGKDERRLVVRVIERATRRYHLSADCYRAIGYATEPMPLFREVDGSMWGRVLASRDGEKVEVRERVVSLDGQSWTDPSSWFWSAMLGRSEGPWVGYAESVPVEGSQVF